jgi:phage repressor protein C with HTH and peptisase S24 domain
MDFLEKLDRLMKIHALNKSSLSKSCDIPYTTIDGWYKKGYESIKLPTLKKLAAFFGTTLDYWANNDDVLHNGGNKYQMTNDEKLHMEHYRSLDPHGKDLVDTVLSKEYERINANELAITIESFDRPKHLITYYYNRVSAGVGEWIFDDLERGRLEVGSSPLAENADFAVCISGDSMEPEYHDGEVVLISAQEEVEAGEIGIFILNGSSYIKKAGSDGLVSLNPKYDVITVSDNDIFRCVGKVVGKLN